MIYRLLIVDNEPFIVQGLSELFLDLKTDETEFELYTAYSSQEAIHWFERIKIDIVLLDINMPGMNGLELQKLINRQWPRCKVIFLTGYDDFEYVRHAIQHGGFDYLLKTDGDDAIVAAVLRATKQVTASMEREQTLQVAQEQLRAVRPLLKRYLLLRLIQGMADEQEMMAPYLAFLRFNLRMDEPILVIVGRIDSIPVQAKPSDLPLYAYAVGNVAQDLLEGCTLESLPIDGRKFAILVQSPRGHSKAPDNVAKSATFIRFVHGMCEQIQSTVQQLLKVRVSFIASALPEALHDLPQVYRRMNKLFYQGLGLNQEALIIEHGDREVSHCGGNQSGEEPDHRSVIPAEETLTLLNELQSLLENGEADRFHELLGRKLDSMLESGASETIFAELYFSLSALLMNYIHRRHVREWFERNAKMQEWFKPLANDEMTGQWKWRAAFSHIEECADLLFSLTVHEKDGSTDTVVANVNRYIEEHLDGDLSLVRLAEECYINPAYLSRLYKQKTGIGVSEYILERRLIQAKLLLADSPLKVNEVAVRVGIDSPSYFGRVFKKQFGMTPKEYRALYL